jgi:hypothetical protein
LFMIFSITVESFVLNLSQLPIIETRPSFWHRRTFTCSPTYFFIYLSRCMKGILVWPNSFDGDCLRWACFVSVEVCQVAGRGISLVARCGGTGLVSSAPVWRLKPSGACRAVCYHVVPRMLPYMLVAACTIVASVHCFAESNLFSAVCCPQNYRRVSQILKQQITSSQTPVPVILQSTSGSSITLSNYGCYLTERTFFCR